MRGKGGRKHLVGATLGAVAMVGLGAVLPAHAAAASRTYSVTTTSDPVPNGCNQAPCSLREAIIAANGHPGWDTVELRGGKLYLLAQIGAPDDASLTGDLDITDPVTLMSVGRGQATVDAHGIDRVFQVFADADTALFRIKVIGGHATNGDGGIQVADADLTLNNSTVSGNTGSHDGGIGVEGGTAHLENSRVIGNTGEGFVGGAEVFHGNLYLNRSIVRDNHGPSSVGGLRIDDGVATLNRSTVAGNDGSAGGIENSAPGSYGSELHISSSTISGNEASITGGGIVSWLGSLEIANSTVAGNTADNEVGGVMVDGGTATLNAVTVARNHAGAGEGGVARFGGTVTVDNSLLALNTALYGQDCSGTFVSGGHNILSTTDQCSGFTGPGDAVVADPRIGELANNGGPTQTIALKAGSPAIGHAGNDAPPRDQRGVRRDAHPDTGAFER